MYTRNFLLPNFYNKDVRNSLVNISISSTYPYDISTPTPLCKIMGDNRSDKGSIDITNSHHNYTCIYYTLFKDIRDNKLRVFELGLGTNNTSLPSNMGKNGRPGASLYGWRDFFVNSDIFGADIDRDILFENERIKTFYCDQTNKSSITELWSNPELKEDFDIIIEDGLHEFYANVCFFENSIHKLNSKGYYIIEDIENKCLDLWKDQIEKWSQTYKDLSFKLEIIPSLINKSDNNLLIVTRN